MKKEKLEKEFLKLANIFYPPRTVNELPPRYTGDDPLFRSVQEICDRYSQEQEVESVKTANTNICY